MCLSDCHVSRRTVLVGLASLATSNITRAASVDTITEYYRYDRSGSTIEAFFARPRTGRVRSLVAVTHGNWGIPEDVRDASLLLAANGFAALAVNPTSREPDHAVIPKSMLEGRELGTAILPTCVKAFAACARKTERRAGPQPSGVTAAAAM
jgi:dienelactone hydrolase